MLECTAMATPMDTHLKLLVDASSDLVDVTLYKQIIGSLIHLTNTQTYICFDVNTLSQYLVKPRHVHLIAAKHVMRYLKGTIDFGLYYDRDHDYILYGYIDSYWERSAADRKSTSCGCYCLGFVMISWFSPVFLSVQLKHSTTCSATWESIWLQKIDVRTI